MVMSPDSRSLFVNVQHPGEGWEGDVAQVSSWPTIDGTSRPRAATVVIEREDGGVIAS